MQLIYENKTSLALAVEEIAELALTDKHFSINTSGTTGEPKEVPVNLGQALQKKRPGGEDERWLLVYNPMRWAGISVILHVLKSKCTLCIPEEFTFEGILSAMGRYQPTHFGCTPAMFKNLLLHDKSNLMSNVPIKQLTFGGEVATQSVLDLAKSLWPSARISDVYASTELGDVCSVSDGLEGVPKQKFSSFYFKDTGELVVNGFETGDLWELRGDRYYFRGRINDIINVGGNKISPIVIEEFALKNGAHSARAYAVPSPLMGSLVALEVVGNLDTVELLRTYRKTFTKYMCPTTISKV